MSKTFAAEHRSQDREERLDRERSFHDARFSTTPSRSALLKSHTQHHILHSLQETYYTVQQYCPGAAVLDYGCAEGQAAELLLKYGARHVQGIDISPVAIQHARARLENSGFSAASFSVMDAESLDFPDTAFDVVFGIGILHHLDLSRALSELSRVLKPDGVAVFLEPLVHNPLINLVRRLTPSLRTDDEHPLSMRDIAACREYFTMVECRYLNLATLASIPLSRFPGARTLYKTLSMGDAALFQLAPFCRRFAWNVILTLRSPRSTCNAHNNS